jgi:hypothetical protein
MLGIIGSAASVAQTFQWVYGGPNCKEAGRYGVLQLAGGGYVAVGESFSNSPGCFGSDIYVVLTNAAGGVVWANTYNIGVNDSATDVIQDAAGNFVVCGVTDNAPPCAPSRDAFLLQLNGVGGVVGVATYGSPNSDEIAWNLIEATTGDGIVTNAGDYIVAGSTTFNAGGARDGYIFRTTNALVLIWDATYGGPASNDDYFYGVYEAVVNAPAGQAADIVTTGGTNTWGAGGYDEWIVRVSGQNGLFLGAPQGAATYGGPRDDEGRAIIEVRNGMNPGDLVTTGISFSRPANINSEVSMVQTGANPCVFVADQYAGDNDPHPDGGIDLKEDAFPSSPNGDVIVTGFTDWGAGAVTPLNAFLQKFQLGNMVPLGAGMAYGGTTLDEGWSVNNCVNVAPGETQGYIVCGFTQSPNLIGVDPQQLYLIKTNLALNSGCNEVPFVFNAIPAAFRQLCFRPAVFHIGQNCRPNINQMGLPFAMQLCYAPSVRERGGNGNDGVASEPETITFKEGNVSGYPNPITSGSTLNLRFELSKSMPADISISDISGRAIFDKHVSIIAGTAVQPVVTDGWAAGTYLVRVSIAGSSTSMRIIVVER